MKKYLAFYIPYFIFLIVLIVLIMSNEKANLHLMLTAAHNEISDTFFRYYTELGGSIPYIFAFLFLFYKYRIGITILVCQLTTGLVAQIIKQLWNEQRPKLFFRENYPDVILHQVEGVRIHLSHSFPSGHTTAAFALFFVLAFYSKKPVIQILCLILAILVGYSRIYLSQHFALDVLVGSIIGVSVSLLSINVLKKYPMKWAEGSMRDVFSRK